MVWTKVDNLSEASEQDQDFRTKYADSDNQILEAIDLCRTAKGHILIFTLWDADFPEKQRIKVWDLLVTAGLDKTDEVMGPTITTSSAEQREKFLAIIFALGKVELQTKIDICEKFELPFDKIENMSLAMFADPIEEILRADSSERFQPATAHEDVSKLFFNGLFRVSSPTFFQDNSSCEESEAPDSEEELALDNEKKLNLSNSPSPFRRSLA